LTPPISKRSKGRVTLPFGSGSIANLPGHLSPSFLWALRPAQAVGSSTRSSGVNRSATAYSASTSAMDDIPVVHNLRTLIHPLPTARRVKVVQDRQRLRRNYNQVLRCEKPHTKPTRPCPSHFGAKTLQSPIETCPHC
jgi:hypothetical protein